MPGPIALIRAGLKARKAFRILNTARKVRKETKKMFKNKQTRSAVRSVLKIVGTVLVTMGVVDAADVPTILDALQAIGGGVLALWGLYLSWKDKRSQE